MYAHVRVPEISGRSLEELDELFARKVSAKDFGAAETYGAGRKVAEIESGKHMVNAVDEEVVQSRGKERVSETATEAA